MGNDVYTYILLKGDKKQIEHFINCHKKSQNQMNDCDVWDCEPFLLDKNCREFLDNKKNYFSTGGRFSQGKNSEGVHFISLASRNGFCDEAIKSLSHYYDKITIKLDYRDEDYEMGIGWLVIKNGDVLGEDYISLSNLTYDKDLIRDNIQLINNKINIMDNQEHIATFISDNKDKYNLKINHDVIEFKTNKYPCYDWFINYIKKYSNLNITLIYNEIATNKYYGYVIVNNGDIIAKEFIYLERDSHCCIPYFKYDSFNNYLESTKELE